MKNNEITLQHYAAKTRFEKHRIDIPFLSEEGIIPIGLDIGYSTTKVYSIFGTYMFLSLPIKVADDFCPPLEDKDIMYKDMEGNIWIVGKLASKNLDEARIQTQPEIIYSRWRINSAEFLVLLRVGLFLGLIEDDLEDRYKIADNSRLAIQTGLPKLYLRGDRVKLEEHFVGKHCYQVKVAKKGWQTRSIRSGFYGQ